MVMTKHPTTPARRRRQVKRAALLLVLLLPLLVVALDFPILTPRQALAATQTRYFFGPGQVITSLDYPRPSHTVRGGQYDRYYILRWNDYYAWCGVNHYGLFWQSGALDAVENDPELPLMPLVVNDWDNGAVLVICNQPDIAQVELSLPISDDSGGYTLYTVRQDQAVESCFLLRLDINAKVHSLRDGLLLRGYDAQGNLLYQSPIPADWTYYGLSGTE